MHTFKRLIRENKKVSITIGVILVVLIVSILRPSSTPTPNTAEQTRSVTTASIQELAQQSSTLPATGQVESESEAVLRAQASGEIVRHAITRGSSVRAGDVIASIENAAEFASLTQANASVAIAEAQLERLLEGARQEELTILAATTKSAAKTLEESQADVYAAVRSAYVTIEDIVRNTIDQMMENPRSNYPTASFHISDSQLNINIENDRFAIEKMLATRTLNEWVPIVILAPAPSNLDAEVERIQTRLTAANTLLDNMILAVNRLEANADITATTITSWKTALASARTKLTGAADDLTDAQNALDTPESNLTIAQENEALGVTGARDEDIRIARATLEQARGIQASARAQFEKTLVRSPISGTLNSLSIELGDIVSINEEVGFVSNNNTLEIVAYLTSANVNKIERGARVRINDSYDGVVEYIAPAIDRATKKVETRISIDRAHTLFNGQSVNLEIEQKPTQDDFSEVRIPLSALKITFDGHLVFTLDSENTLVGHSVVPGSLVGDDIIILEGLTPDMEIVLDARGFKEGDTVTHTN